jgi:hypothetical protein
MAKHKSVTHLPPPPAPAAPPARLAVQLMTALGELVIVAAYILGIVTAVGWALAGLDRRSRTVRPALPPTEYVCWHDRLYGEMCLPADRPPVVRRHYARYSRD